MNSKRVTIIGAVVGTVMACLILGWLVVRWIDEALDTPTTSDAALATMEQYLSDIENGVIGPPPEGAWPFDCRILYNYMANNGNQYTLTVAGVYEPNREVSLFVDFPDGSRVEAYFYQGGLLTCKPTDN